MCVKVINVSKKLGLQTVLNTRFSKFFSLQCYLLQAQHTHKVLGCAHPPAQSVLEIIQPLILRLLFRFRHCSSRLPESTFLVLNESKLFSWWT